MVSQVRALTTKHLKSCDEYAIELNDSIHCKVSCSGCCHSKVTVTLGEALSIYDLLVKTNRWDALKPTIEEHFKLYEFMDEISWRKARITCLMLDQNTNLCSIYQNRPIQCGVHFSLQNGEACDPWYTGPTKNGEYDLEVYYRKFREESLTVLSPVYLNLAGSLYDMLLRAEKLVTKNDVSFEEYMRVMS